METSVFAFFSLFTSPKKIKKIKKKKQNDVPLLLEMHKKANKSQYWLH